MRPSNLFVAIPHTNRDLEGLGATLRALDLCLENIDVARINVCVVNSSDDNRLNDFISTLKKSFGKPVSVCNLTDLVFLTRDYECIALIIGGDLPSKNMLELCFDRFTSSVNKRALIVRPIVEYHFYESDFKYYSDIGRPHWSSKSHFKVFSNSSQDLVETRISEIFSIWGGALLTSREVFLECALSIDATSRGSHPKSNWIRVFSSSSYTHEHADDAFIATRH